MTILTKAVETIERALRGGAKLHAFTSGGGLRVLRLSSCDGEHIGYGEHPNVEEAFTHLAEDFEAGVRPYDEVYGVLHPHYLTGSSTCTSPLDAWLRRGSKFDAFYENGEIVFVLSGYAHNEPPEGYQDRVMAGETLTYANRGYVYRMEPSRFPNGERCTCTTVVSKPSARKGSDSTMWPITKTGRAEGLKEAIDRAFKAEEIEVSRRPHKAGGFER